MYIYFGSLAEKMTHLAAGAVATQIPVWDIPANARRLLAGDFGSGVAQNMFYWMGLVAAVGVIWVISRRAKAGLDDPAGSGAEKGASTSTVQQRGYEGPEDLEPDDAFNRQLRENVHPSDWTNPSPEGVYNLVAIGAGTAGLVGAAGAAGLGARSALVERNLMGGDCLVTGCVPSKGVIRSARAASQVRRASEFGIGVDGHVNVDFAEVMKRMRRIRSEISEEDSAERFDSLGVDVYLGDARFVDGETIEVGDRKLRFKKALIATGGRPFVPAIDGLEKAGYLTSETVFELTELPERIAVIGGGPIGCELAQSFRRFGADVTVVELTDSLLGREDPDAAALVEAALRADGVDLRLASKVTAVGTHNGEKVLAIRSDEGDTDELAVDAILLAVGRAPNVEGLGLGSAGVAYDAKAGIDVDDHLQTTNPNIYAAGDVASPYKFTHTADAQARLVVQNALFFGRAKARDLVVPWCTYSDPEVAHVGLHAEAARERGYDVETVRQDLDGVHRALLDGESEGFLKVHLKAGTDEILGATLVADHAGDMISELTLAMTADIGLATIADTIHPYPTTAAIHKRAADAYNRSRLKPWMKSVLETWFGLTR